MLIYHLSTNSNLTKLTPRIPKYAVESCEDISTKRICFAKSIEGCLSALQDIIPETYYVYIPAKNINKYNLYFPTVYDVIDGPSNGEVWILEEVDVICIGKIYCFENPYNRKINTKRGVTYFHHHNYMYIDK